MANHMLFRLEVNVPPLLTANEAPQVHQLNRLSRLWEMIRLANKGANMLSIYTVPPSQNDPSG